MTLLDIRNLSVEFHTEEGIVRAVDEVSFDIPRGKTVCLVGESGCGKSVSAYSLLGLVSPPWRGPAERRDSAGQRDRAGPPQAL
jgi:ABC-type dipeptide/oligopeptide/nickel transport system ATPase component